MMETTRHPALWPEDLFYGFRITGFTNGMDVNDQQYLLDVIASALLPTGLKFRRLVQRLAHDPAVLTDDVPKDKMTIQPIFFESSTMESPDLIASDMYLCCGSHMAFSIARGPVACLVKPPLKLTSWEAPRCRLLTIEKWREAARDDTGVNPPPIWPRNLTPG